MTPIAWHRGLVALRSQSAMLADWVTVAASSIVAELAALGTAGLPLTVITVTSWPGRMCTTQVPGSLA